VVLASARAVPKTLMRDLATPRKSWEDRLDIFGNVSEQGSEYFDALRVANQPMIRKVIQEVNS